MTIGADRRLLDHVGKVALVHLGHAAAGMAGREIAAEQLILLLGRPRLAGGDFEIGVAAHQLALGGVGLELGGEHADRDAGGAVDAARPIGDGLAAAEADPAERVVELARHGGPLSSVNTFRSTLPGRYGHGRRVGHEELGKRNGALTRTRLSKWLRNSLCDW